MSVAGRAAEGRASVPLRSLGSKREVEEFGVLRRANGGLVTGTSRSKRGRPREEETRDWEEARDGEEERRGETTLGCCSSGGFKQRSPVGFAMAPRHTEPSPSLTPCPEC